MPFSPFTIQKRPLQLWVATGAYYCVPTIKMV